LRINKLIRVPQVRLIDTDGKQIGVVTIQEALQKAEEAGLDLVEISPNAVPPVCKIVDYGKYRYNVTKKEKESKKAQHQVKVKEIKVKPNIDSHDLETKTRQAKDFLLKGNKVKITCMFRGREMAHTEFGEKVINRMCELLSEVSQTESSPKQMGRIMTVVLAPKSRKK
jgi:translation initiation factor IF-3